MVRPRVPILLLTAGLALACAGATPGEAGDASPEGTAGPDAADGAGSSDLGGAPDAGPDDAAPDRWEGAGEADADASGDVDGAGVPESRVEEVPADVALPLAVSLHVEGATCDAGVPGRALYRVDLRWTTSMAAASEVQVALNDLQGAPLVGVGGEPALETGYALEVSAFDFGQVPKVGDAILARVHATVPGSLVEGWSEPVAVTVTAAVRACLYPYDPECSDNAMADCQGPVPACAPPLVLAAFDGCFHCVYAATCTCDDGSLVTCEDPPPICADGELLVPRQGCRVCVDPATCLPPG